MSRGKGDGHVVHGARMVKHHRWTSSHRGTWPANPEDSRESEPDTQPVSKRQKRQRVVKEKGEKPGTDASHLSHNPVYGDYNMGGGHYAGAGRC